MRWWKVVLAVVLVLVLSTGGVSWYAVEVPQSQPCLWPPAGAHPAPEPVDGSPSGRSGPLTIALAGDTMLGRGVNRRAARSAEYDPFASLRPVLAGADLVALNLECTLTEHTQRFGGKTYAFRAEPELAARTLARLPAPPHALRFASLANNHALDYGPQGLLDTVALLSQEGWAHAGAGATATEASRPFVFTTDAGVRVGLLSLTDHCSCTRLGTWKAGSHQPGVFHEALSLRSGRLLRAAQELDGAVDVVVVSLHWGANYHDPGQAPTGWMRRVARGLVQAGADVVVGHSAHEVLPVEVVEGKHVLYGTGDLLDDYRFREEHRNDLGFIARIHLDEEGHQSLEIVPARIREDVVQRLRPRDPDYAEVMRRAGPTPNMR